MIAGTMRHARIAEPVMRLLPLLSFLCAAAVAGAAHADPKPSAVKVAPPKLLEPTMRLAPSQIGVGRVALTLDACGGATDQRILDALVENRIPATIFVTGLWLKHNGKAFAVMQAHPDLFELEDHGARHRPAVDVPTRVYGIRAAGSPEAVTEEVEGGAHALESAGGAAPHWFRGATAKYDASAMTLIGQLGFRIAGYSLNADGGSLLGAATTQKRVARAKDGDVIIAHINQPTHAAGAGLVKGLLELKAKGVTFVRLRDAGAIGGGSS
jgi:peptidoglycan/xylan/chitin deacetylase (PgdA/CDA1 family)